MKSSVTSSASSAGLQLCNVDLPYCSKTGEMSTQGQRSSAVRLRLAAMANWFVCWYSWCQSHAVLALHHDAAPAHAAAKRKLISKAVLLVYLTTAGEA